MKYAVFFVALAAAVVASRLVRDSARARQAIVFLLGFMPFVDLDDFAVNFLSMESYRGDAKGFEVTIIDLLAVVLWFSFPRGEVPASPLRKSRWLFAATAVVSAFLAWMPVYAWFDVWKVLRAYFVFAAVWRGLTIASGGQWLLRGFALGVIWNLLLALQQRYLWGLYQASGAFPHPNTLGLAVNTVTPIAIALLLAGHGGRLAALWAAAGAACVLLSLSRGALMMTALSVGIVFVGSAYRGITRRKVWIFILSGLCAMVLFGYAADSVVERFLNAPEASVEARERFEEAARLMLSDHNMGIGMNNYSYVLGAGEYGEKVGLPETDYGGIAHHIYWLTLCELGPIGLFAFLLLIVTPIAVAIRPAMRALGDVRADVILGMLAGLAAMAIHGLAEWAWRQTPVMHLFFTSCALLMGLREQMRRDGVLAR